MQRPLDARAVVITERSHARGDELEVFGGHWRVVEDDLVVREACFRLPSEVEDDLEEQALVIEPLDGAVQMRRQRLKEQGELSRGRVGQTGGGSAQFLHCFSPIWVPVAL